MHDELTSPVALAEWLAAVTDYERSELGGTSQRELAEALLLRDSLRRLAAYSTGDERPGAQSPVSDLDEAVAAVNAALADSPQTELASATGGSAGHQAAPGLGRPKRAGPARTGRRRTADRTRRSETTGLQRPGLRALLRQDASAPRMVLRRLRQPRPGSTPLPAHPQTQPVIRRPLPRP